MEAHTCDDPPPSSSHAVPDPTAGSDALLVPPVPTVPFPSAQCYGGGRPSPPPLPPYQVPYAATTLGSNVLTLTATGVLLPSASYDPVPDVTDCTPSLEQEQDHDLLHIPSPACSQSELLPMEAAKLSPHAHGLPLSLEHTLDCDFAVPEL